MKSRYETDFYAWAMEQAQAIREDRISVEDRERIAEEIESLGRQEFATLRSRLSVLLAHLLKWEHQPNKRSWSWKVTIATQREKIQEVLEDNPSLQSRLAEATAKAYRRAVLLAMKETGLERSMFPNECPYTLEQILPPEES